MAATLNLVGTIFAILAAVLWFKSSSVQVDKNLFEVTADRTTFEREREWARETGKWNKYAALSSGVAALFFGIGSIV